MAKQAIMPKLEAFGLPALHDPNNEITTAPALFAAERVDAYCVTPWAALKATPRGRAATVTEALFGEPLQIIDRSDAWLKVAMLTDCYVGWILAGATTRSMPQPTHRATAAMSHIYRDADLKSEPLMPLPMGAFVATAGEAQGGFLPLATGGHAVARHLTPVGETVADPVASAEQFLSAPYLWGGRTKIGVDCSGLVQAALAAAGHRVLRDSGSQWRSLGDPLPPEAAPRRGDLAFFPGHVGWMLDAELMLHANATNMAVTIDPVSEVTDWIRRAGSDEPFLGFRRL